jgi:hypothetical protein
MSVPFDEIKNAVGSDPSYAWSWHCNLAMSALDASKGTIDHTTANVIAAGQMRHLFQYDITVLQEYKDVVASGDAMALDDDDPDQESTLQLILNLLRKIAKK